MNADYRMTIETTLTLNEQEAGIIRSLLTQLPPVNPEWRMIYDEVISALDIERIKDSNRL